jgi:hypothetical protein
MLLHTLLLTCVLSNLLVPACARATSLGDAAPRASLGAYRSEAEFEGALARWRREAERLQGERRRDLGAAKLMLSASAAPAAEVAALQKSASMADAADSITNVQTAGVDEGGIVKRAGDHLVILRRGRLFTVRVGGDALQPAASIDAYAPGSDPQGAWYDELLISGSTVVVIGYSYARGGTEIGLFEFGADGALAYRDTYHLRSFDYYSSRNYASRLIGRKLVFYTPSLLHPSLPGSQDQMPALRRWQGQATPAEFKRILPATRIYRTDDEFDPRDALALHTVTSCDLDAQPLNCESTAVLGAAGRVFYVSGSAVYVWTSAFQRRRLDAPSAGPSGGSGSAAAQRSLSAIFRMPLDGAAPSGIKTAGVPIDQMSFLEENGHLDVLVRESGNGEGMWGSERSGGSLALLRLPLAAFGDGSEAAQRAHYRALPAAAGGAIQNRFVGDWLIWGVGSGHAGGASPDRSAPATAWALRYAAGAPAQALAPGHGVERIEALGAHAVLVGNAGADLQFSSVRLDAAGAQLAGRHVQPNASQGETRTHGFFYRPTGAADGLLGLPVLEAGKPSRYGVFVEAQGSASVLYLRQRDLAFSALGRLAARPGRMRDDGCRASCVDWYGNARPIFLGERVFALLGYELVEGRLAGRAGAERIEDRRRISFAPAPLTIGRYSPFE